MHHPRVPVVALTGHLGAGKTTVLNRLLCRPGARIGVVINDYGAINVDAALVAGQVDAAASIAGGCLCCLPDSGGLDEALERLTHPKLRLDAVVVEASGVAEPLALARLIRFSGAPHSRPGGLIDVIDASAYFETLDPGWNPPARFAAASLVVVNKVDLLPASDRDEIVERIRGRVRRRNPVAPIVVTSNGGLDPALVFDVADERDRVDELPLAEAARRHHGHAEHPHADAVSVPAAGPVHPGRLLDLLEDPPPGVYRLKGILRIQAGGAGRWYAVNLVGPHIHIAPAHTSPVHTTPAAPSAPDLPALEAAQGLVAIGAHLDAEPVRARLERALAPCPAPAGTQATRRLARVLRLSH